MRPRRREIAAAAAAADRMRLFIGIFMGVDVSKHRFPTSEALPASFLLRSVRLRDLRQRHDLHVPFRSVTRDHQDGGEG